MGMGKAKRKRASARRGHALRTAEPMLETEAEAGGGGGAHEDALEAAAAPTAAQAGGAPTGSSEQAVGAAEPTAQAGAGGAAPAHAVAGTAPTHAGAVGVAPPEATSTFRGVANPGSRVAFTHGHIHGVGLLSTAGRSAALPVATATVYTSIGPLAFARSPLASDPVLGKTFWPLRKRLTGKDGPRVKGLLHERYIDGVGFLWSTPFDSCWHQHVSTPKLYMHGMWTDWPAPPPRAYTEMEELMRRMECGELPCDRVGSPRRTT
jgi:hypothetical protein